MSFNDEEKEYIVHGPYTWENDYGPDGWYAVSDYNGIFAYFGNESYAYDYAESMNGGVDYYEYD